MLRIDAKYFTAYHSETDEQTERPNAIMKHYLQAFVNYMQDDWAKWIPGAEFTVNNVSSVITLASFFLVNSGQNSHLCYSSWIRTDNTYVNSYSIYSKVAYKSSDL